jgi:hypothetical protein
MISSMLPERPFRSGVWEGREPATAQCAKPVAGSPAGRSQSGREMEKTIDAADPSRDYARWRSRTRATETGQERSGVGRACRGSGGSGIIGDYPRHGCRPCPVVEGPFRRRGDQVRIEGSGRGVGRAWGAWGARERLIPLPLRNAPPISLGRAGAATEFSPPDQPLAPVLAIDGAASGL